VIAERFPVEATHILMFARAIGDENPAYTDLDRPGGTIAPPTFVMAGAQFIPDHPVRPKKGVPWFGSGREPSGVTRAGGGMLHAEQHFEYHAPLTAGMTLTSSEHEGKAWEKQNKKGDTLRFTETVTEYRDVATGVLVVTATMVGVFTQPAAKQEG
jgi:hypothetical protein